MRKLNTIQKRQNLNEVYAIDETGTGGANHKYKIISNIEPTISEDDPFYAQKEYSRSMKKNNPKTIETTIQFQNGGRYMPHSTHGVLDVDLLEIVRDRLKDFQKGKFPTEYNAKALEHIEIALMYLNRRVEDRIERNVLGTENK